MHNSQRCVVLVGGSEIGSFSSEQRGVHEWYPLFGDELLASAAMDRLLHQVHVVTMLGDSYRTPKAGHPTTGCTPVPAAEGHNSVATPTE